MKKACLLDQTVQFPPVGTRVAIHDDEELGLPHPGTVCGHGQATAAGSNVNPSTPLVPVVLVQVDDGMYLPGWPTWQRCHVSVIAVHPDNLLLDENGNWVDAL